VRLGVDYDLRGAMSVLRSGFQRVYLFLRRLFALERASYLCDTCKWDYGNACKRPERPNAKTCPDYKRR
jgi:hypothetical protein